MLLAGGPRDAVAPLLLLWQGIDTLRWIMEGDRRCYSLAPSHRFLSSLDGGPPMNVAPAGWDKGWWYNRTKDV